MTDKEAREAASSVVSRRAHKIPEDVEFATKEDIDGLQEELEVVPLKMNDGTISNWLVRQLTSGEKAVISRTMFSKSAVQAIVMGNQIDPEQTLSLDPDNGYISDLLTIKQGTVFPENLTIDDVARLSAEHIDKLLDKINKSEETDAADAVSSLPEDDSAPTEAKVLPAPTE